MSRPGDACGSEFQEAHQPRRRSHVEHHEIDRPLTDVGPRPCSCCGNSFQPTLRRRRLCKDCFVLACESAGNPFEPHDEAETGML